MKLLNKHVCLTSKGSILIIASLLLSTLVIASVLNTTPVIEEIIIEKEVEVWVPTVEDIAFERLDYPDGTYDSIRYAVGGKIDKMRNDNE